MFGASKPEFYFNRCNPALLQAVPQTALRILDVGCAAGALGAELKRMNPERNVIGIERETQAAELARRHLDEVHCLDVEAEDAPIEPGTLDCVVFGDVLEHLIAPDQALARCARYLRPDGVVVASIPNVQHSSILEAILTGDFQYTTEGLLDATHLRFFTYSTIVKMFLDVGLAPRLVNTVITPSPPQLMEAADPLCRLFGLDLGRTRGYLDAYQYIMHGTPLPSDCALARSVPSSEADRETEPPLSFVACVYNENVLQANLLSSPCLAQGAPHEVLLMRDCRSAAEGLNRGLKRASNPVVVFVHQDVYLPQGWPSRFWKQYLQAKEQFGSLGVVGVYGVAGAGPKAEHVGRVVDRDRLLWGQSPLPAVVDTIDELLLAVPNGTPLSVDARFGFHLYGADLCLEAQSRGLRNVVVDALCFHNSRTGVLPESFRASFDSFAQKWRPLLPVTTTCAHIA
jgi:2-polyprenyl-3-methyl-5-hydroxy-6-metoxy-1,4-benzoquinol methylase